MKKMYIFILLIFFFIGGALLGKYFTTTPSKALYITHLVEGETTIEQIHLLDTDKTRGNLIDEYIFGLINSEKKLNITLPDEEPQYLLKLSSADNSIWWLEHYIWFNEDYAIIASKTNDSFQTGTLFSKNSSLYSTLTKLYNR